MPIGYFTPIKNVDTIVCLETCDDISVNKISTNNMESVKSREKYIKIATDIGIKIDNHDLTVEQKQDLLVFEGQNRDVFAKDLSELELATNMNVE